MLIIHHQLSYLRENWTLMECGACLGRTFFRDADPHKSFGENLLSTILGRLSSHKDHYIHYRMTQVRIRVQSAATQDCVNVWYHPLVFHPPVTLIGTFEHTIARCTWTRDHGKRCSRKCRGLTGLMLIHRVPLPAQCIMGIR